MKVKTILRSNPRPLTMNAIYTILSSAVAILLFAAGWSIAVGRKSQTIDDLKSGFVRAEADVKRLEESITKLVDRISKIEGKVDGVAVAVSSMMSPGKQ
jgi:hypothetical protein